MHQPLAPIHHLLRSAGVRLSEFPPGDLVPGSSAAPPGEPPEEHTRSGRNSDFFLLLLFFPPFESQVMIEYKEAD